MNDHLAVPAAPIPAAPRTNDPYASPASSSSPVLPHHKLLAYGVARDLLLAVLRCSIRDTKLRDEAVRSAKSACLNCAEGAGRVSRADKARSFAIARAEAVEAAAARRRTGRARPRGRAGRRPARRHAHPALPLG
jgi:hypothetical protein